MQKFIGEDPSAPERLAEMRLRNKLNWEVQLQAKSLHSKAEAAANVSYQLRVYAFTFYCMSLQISAGLSLAIACYLLAGTWLHSSACSAARVSSIALQVVEYEEWEGKEHFL